MDQDNFLLFTILEIFFCIESFLSEDTKIVLGEKPFFLNSLLNIGCWQFLFLITRVPKGHVSLDNRY